MESLTCRVDLLYDEYLFRISSFEFRIFGRGVIPTFLIDLPVLTLFGVLFAFFTRHESRQGSFTSSHYFWHGIVFSTIFNGMVFYSNLKYPDWMWMYFVGGITLGPLETIYIFFFLYYVPYVAGFALGREIVFRCRLTAFLLALFLVGFEGWIVWHLFDRYSVVGSQADYLAGTAISLFSPQNPLSLPMNITLGAMGVYFAVIWWRHRRCISKTTAESEF